MKKIILSLVLLGTINPVYSQENSNIAITQLSWSEHFYLNNFYQANMTDSYYIPKLTDKNLDYYLHLLEKHIEIIQYKIGTQESWWKNSELKIALSLSTSLAAGLFGIGIYPILREFFTGTYEKVEVPVRMLETISALKLTRSERKKLDTITVDKTTFIYNNLSEKSRYYDIVSKLTKSDLKKIEYLTRKLAIEKAQKDILIGGGSILFLIAAIVCVPIYNAINYSEYLQEQLQKDKVLYDLLHREKMQRQVT